MSVELPPNKLTNLVRQPPQVVGNQHWVEGPLGTGPKGVWVHRHPESLEREHLIRSACELLREVGTEGAGELGKNRSFHGLVPPCRASSAGTTPGTMRVPDQAAAGTGVKPFACRTSAALSVHDSKRTGLRFNPYFATQFRGLSRPNYVMEMGLHHREGQRRRVPRRNDAGTAGTRALTLASLPARSSLFMPRPRSVRFTTNASRASAYFEAIQGARNDSLARFCWPSSVGVWVTWRVCMSLRSWSIRSRYVREGFDCERRSRSPCVRAPCAFSSAAVSSYRHAATTVDLERGTRL